MVRAKHLSTSIAKPVIPQAPVSFFHLLLENHDVIFANGLEAESFQPSLRSYFGLPPSMKKTFHTNVGPELRPNLFHRPDAMLTLNSHEAAALMAYMSGGGARTTSDPSLAEMGHSKIAA